MAQGGERWARGLGEVVIVFVGVTLGLFAENWRQNQNDEEVVFAILGQLEGDLRTDSVQMAELLESTDLGHARGLELLRELGGAALRGEYALQAALGLIPGVVFRPATTAYGSLSEGGQLALIPDTSLRNAISVYYEQDQSLVTQLGDELRTYQRGFREAVGLHMRLAVDDSASSMLEAPTFAWTTSPGSFAQDHSIRVTLEDLTIASAELSVRIAPIVERNSDLRAALRHFNAER